MLAVYEVFCKIRSMVTVPVILCVFLEAGAKQITSLSSLVFLAIQTCQLVDTTFFIFVTWVIYFVCQEFCYSLSGGKSMCRPAFLSILGMSLMMAQ
jgi:hypothetical protein